MTKPISELLPDLLEHGGCVVCSDRCSEMELAFARTEGRFYVREDHIGFVRRYAAWVKNAEQLISGLTDTGQQYDGRNRFPPLGYSPPAGFDRVPLK